MYIHKPHRELSCQDKKKGKTQKEKHGSVRQVAAQAVLERATQRREITALKKAIADGLAAGAFEAVATREELGSLGFVGWWVGGLVGWWVCGWWVGGLVGLWVCGLVGWWVGGLVGLWVCGLVGGLVGWWVGGFVGW